MSSVAGLGDTAGMRPLASRFCTAHDEVRGYFRHRARLHEVVPLWVQREQSRARLAALRAMLWAA